MSNLASDTSEGKTAEIDLTTFNEIYSLVESGQYTKARKQLSVKAKAAKIPRALKEFVEEFVRMFTDGAPASAIHRMERLLVNDRSEPIVHTHLQELFARALAIASSFSAIAADNVVRARHELSSASSQFFELGAHTEALKTRMYLAQLYSTGTYPDYHTARMLLNSIVNSQGIESEIHFDAKRRLLEITYLQDLFTTTEAALREIFQFHIKLCESGGLKVLEGLTRISLARVLKSRNVNITEELEAALRIFKDENYPIGAFEAHMSLATHCLEQGHYVKAEKCYENAIAVASEMGFCEGMLVSQLGLIQVFVSKGAKDSALPVLQRVLPLASKLPSFGLSIAASFQLLGDLESARDIVAAAEKYYEEQRLLDAQSQALFVEGACHAGLGKWGAAKKAWNKAAVIDRNRGDRVAEVEKLIAISQSQALEEFSEKGAISETTLKKIAKTLKTATQVAAAEPLDSRGIKLEGKIAQSSAQLKVIAKNSYEALRDFSAARDKYQSARLFRDVAFVDALSGLALIEVARAGKPDLFYEAKESFMRAREYFSGEGLLPVRWKIHYYLALVSLFISNAKNSDVERYHAKEEAGHWISLAMQDVERLKASGVTPPPDNELSPGLTYESLGKLAQQIGIDKKQGVKAKKIAVGKKTKQELDQLH